MAMQDTNYFDLVKKKIIQNKDFFETDLSFAFSSSLFSYITNGDLIILDWPIDYVCYIGLY